MPKNQRLTAIISVGCAAVAIPLLILPALPALALVLAGVSLVCAWVSLRGRGLFPATPDVFIGGLFLTALVGTLITIAPDLSRNRFLSLLSGAVAYYAVFALVQTQRDVTRASAVLALIGGALAVVGFLIADWSQAVIWPQSQPFYDMLPHIALAVPGSGIPRVSEFASPRLLAGYLAVLAPLAAAQARARRIFWGVAALMLGVIVLTQSVLAFGAAAVALAVFALAGWRSRRLNRILAMALAAGAAAITLIFALPGARQLGNTAIDLTTRVFAHTDMLRLAAQITRDAPIVPNGLNTFPVVVTCYYPHPAERDISFYPHAHNAFAQAAVDGGLVGMFSAIGLVFWMCYAPLAAAWRAQDKAWRIALAGLACSVVAYLAYNIFEGLILGNKLIAIVWAVFALGQAASQTGQTAGERSDRLMGRWLVIGFALAVAAVLIYALASGALAQNIALVQQRILAGACVQ